MKRARILARLALAALLACPIAACDKSLGTIDFSGPIDIQWRMLRVFVQNSGSSEILVSYRGGTPMSAPAGGRVYLTPYSSVSPLPASDSFSIQRGSATLANVSFQPIRLPETKGETKDTTIVIAEPFEGRFTATAVEPDWIRIVAVTQP